MLTIFGYFLPESCSMVSRKGGVLVKVSPGEKELGHQGSLGAWYTLL